MDYNDLYTFRNFTWPDGEVPNVADLLAWRTNLL